MECDRVYVHQSLMPADMTINVFTRYKMKTSKTPLFIISDTCQTNAGYVEMYRENICHSKQYNSLVSAREIKQCVIQWPDLWLDYLHTASHLALLGNPLVWIHCFSAGCPTSSTNMPLGIQSSQPHNILYEHNHVISSWLLKSNICLSVWSLTPMECDRVYVHRSLMPADVTINVIMRCKVKTSTNHIFTISETNQTNAGYVEDMYGENMCHSKQNISLVSTREIRQCVIHGQTFGLTTCTQLPTLHFLGITRSDHIASHQDVPHLVQTWHTGYTFFTATQYLGSTQPYYFIVDFYNALYV